MGLAKRIYTSKDCGNGVLKATTGDSNVNGSRGCGDGNGVPRATTGDSKVNGSGEGAGDGREDRCGDVTSFLNRFLEIDRRKLRR